MVESAMLKRLLPLLIVLALLSVSHVLAQGSGISYPPETEVVRGVIEIRGTAAHSEFWKYELAAAPFGTQNWFNITVNETPVTNGVLGVWNTGTVQDGTYTLRLRVVKRDGNYDEYTTQRVLVGNALPSPTPTADVSPTATITPTSEPPTATPVVVTPDIPTPTAAAPTETPTPVGASDEGGDGNEDEDEDSTSALIETAIDAFFNGIRIVLAIFLVIGFFFAVKHILTWLYYRFLA